MPTVHFRGSRDDLKRLLQSLPAILSGRAPDPTGLADGVSLRVGTQALSLIREAFVEKSRGGTDDAGEKWEPLSPKTIARRRVGAGDRARLTRKARTARLSDAEKREYRRLARDHKASLMARGVDAKEAGSLAEGYAAMTMKARGSEAQSRTDVLAARDVEILRDTGVLLNSLSPGMEGNDIEARSGSVTLGTNVPYAPRHHEGTDHIPQRRLWPEPEKWPDEWWREIKESAVEGVAELIEVLLRMGR